MFFEVMSVPLVSVLSKQCRSMKVDHLGLTLFLRGRTKAKENNPNPQKIQKKWF